MANQFTTPSLCYSLSMTLIVIKIHTHLLKHSFKSSLSNLEILKLKYFFPPTLLFPWLGGKQKHVGCLTIFTHSLFHMDAQNLENHGREGANNKFQDLDNDVITCHNLISPICTFFFTITMHESSTLLAPLQSIFFPSV